MDTIEYQIQDKDELNLACMPFIKNGGLFFKLPAIYPLGTLLSVQLRLCDEPTPVKFTGLVVWKTPKRERYQLPEGFGLQFVDEDAKAMRDKIDSLLPNAFATDKMQTGILVGLPS